MLQVFYAHIIGLGVFSLSDLHHPFQKIAVQAAKRLLKPVFKGLFPQEQKQNDHNSRGGNNHDFLFHFRLPFFTLMYVKPSGFIHNKPQLS